MAKKIFEQIEIVIPTARAPSVCMEEPDSAVDSSSRNSPVSIISQQLPVLILDETGKSFPKINATGRSLLIKFRPPAEHVEPTVYLKECITALTIYLVDDVRDRHLVGLRIRNSGNVHDRFVCITLRRSDQLKPGVFWVCWGRSFSLMRGSA